MKKTRADILLVERGLAESRAKAQALILAGQVFKGDERLAKAGDKLPADAPLEVRGQLPYVSRGGEKLAGALDDLRFDPKGMVVADFGASTGGFTDCVLQRGATRVYAIDVGRGQLHNKLRKDERVVVMERTNARHLTETDLPEPVDLVVIDASFIGIEKLFPAAAAISKPAATILAMVKPQFQVGKGELGRGGVVRDDALRKQAADDVAAAARVFGYEERERTDSRVHGPKGNREIFLHLVRRA